MRSLRVLPVEDNPDHAELAGRALLREAHVNEAIKIWAYDYVVKSGNYLPERRNASGRMGCFTISERSRQTEQFFSRTAP